MPIWSYNILVIVIIYYRTQDPKRSRWTQTKYIVASLLTSSKDRQFRVIKITILFKRT